MVTGSECGVCRTVFWDVVLHSAAELDLIKVDSMQVCFLFDFSIPFITLNVINSIL